MRTLIRSVVVLMLVSGCASDVWRRSGVSGIQVVEDTIACQRHAVLARVEVQETMSGNTKVLLPASSFDRNAFDACMLKLGYARREPR